MTVSRNGNKLPRDKPGWTDLLAQLIGTITQESWPIWRHICFGIAIDAGTTVLDNRASGVGKGQIASGEVFCSVRPKELQQAKTNNQQRRNCQRCCGLKPYYLGTHDDSIPDIGGPC